MYKEKRRSWEISQLGVSKQHRQTAEQQHEVRVIRTALTELNDHPDIATAPLAGQAFIALPSRQLNCTTVTSTTHSA
jgi:hypothetical protein